MIHPHILSNNLPPPPDFENKFQRSVGIMIGFGIGLAVICFVAALFEYSHYSDISRILSNGGIESQGYLAKDLVRNTLSNTAFFLAFGVGGILTTIIGLLSSGSNIFREALYYNRDKHFLGNFLFGVGFALIILSLRHVFLYLLAQNIVIINQNFELNLFAGLFSVGIILFGIGMISWRLNRAKVSFFS
jgi:hypothetical protein